MTVDNGRGAVTGKNYLKRLREEELGFD